jgi:hypothetical protein
LKEGLAMTTDSMNFNTDKESRKTMVKELAIINGLISDNDNKIDDLNEYFKKLGV